jgi:hypothetical protein
VKDGCGSACGRNSFASAAAGGKLSLLRPIENAAANVIGKARGSRGGSSLTYSSKGTLVGAGFVTDPICLSKASVSLNGESLPFVVIFLPA